MNEPTFIEFPKIARLNREVIATEKIDGTNALVHVGEDGSVRAGSRSRWITPEADNFGFAKWVAEHATELGPKLGPGYHYGEWWGAGIQRRYGLPEKRFSLFNVARWSDYDARPECCQVVPILARGLDIRAVAEEALETLRRFGSVAAPGYFKPEGIVLFHTASRHLYKVTLERDEERKDMRKQRPPEAAQ